MVPDAPTRLAQIGRPPLPTRLPRPQVDDPRRPPGARGAAAVDAGARGRPPSLTQYGRAGLRAAVRRRLCRQPQPRDCVGSEVVAGARVARAVPPEAGARRAGLGVCPAPDRAAPGATRALDRPPLRLSLRR